MIVQVQGNNRAPMTATAAPSNIIMQGSSDIYVVNSLHALTDNAGVIITLADNDKETLDKLIADGVNTAVLIDSGGNLSVRYQYLSIGALLIVFLVSNGQGQTYIVGYQYASGQCRCIIRYKLADIGVNDTMLTAQNWEQYITVPTGGEWIKTEDMSDINLYNAKELCILFYLYNDVYTLYIVCPDGLGANPNRWYYVATYFQSATDASAAVYNGQTLLLSGTYDNREVYYKL